jgi:multidrug resistance efflux pump
MESMVLKMKKVIYLLFVLISVSSLMGGCAKTQEEKELKKEGGKVSINLEATVFPSRVQQIVASSSGYVKNVYVKNGDKVKAGDILYSLNKESLRYDIKGARSELASLYGMRSAAWAAYSSKSNLAAVNLAASELRDVSELRSQGYTNSFDENNYKKNYINAMSTEKNSRMNDYQRVKSIDAEIASKKASIEKMEYELANSNGIASVDGFVAGLNITIGQPITADSKICTIVNLDTVIVRGGFATGLLPFIHVGQKVNIDFVTTPPFKTTANVTQVNPVIDPDFRNMTVEIAIPNKNYILQANTKALILISLSKDGQKTVNEYFSHKNDKSGIYEVKSAN